jgi:predicted enzyme related to lactoylglutathione lyase
MNSALNWFEIPVKDIPTAAAFYTKVTGQRLDVVKYNNIPHAIFAPTGAGPGVHGALIEDPERIPGATGTVIYLAVTDGVAAALDRVRALGAEIVQPLTDLGEHGTCALIHDRDGNLIGLHTSKA